MPVELDRTETQVGPPPPATRAIELPPGKQLDHYRIERKLGAGGMGEVYLATDLALDRPAAIKVLPEALAADPKRRERMIREARAQARVAHPNVGHMYFIGEADHRLYFAMEYVAGETLGERIAKGPMPVDDALAVIRAATLGLREAQRCGITHRDVKPSNLMIDGHGVVKVLDFGLAAGAEGAVTGPVAQTSLAGTPLYMAPEQARGEAVDFRTDIYALGATLYHLVSGKPPFEADSVEELLSKHATAARPTMPPRKGQNRAQVGRLGALCNRMMAAKPEDRFASYEELLRAIELASTETRRAGFWVRALAMLLDFIIVAIIVGIVRIGIAIPTMPTIIPLLALLQTLAVTRWGTSPGKAAMELEVVDVETLSRPTPHRNILRALMLFGVPIAMAWINVFLPGTQSGARASSTDGGGLTITTDGWVGVVTLLWGVICFVSLLFASPWISGRRTLWDHVAGTMVRYRTTRRSLGTT